MENEFMKHTEQELSGLLSRYLNEIEPLDRIAIEKAASHWNHLVKPLGSLGRLEEDITQIAGIRGTSDVRLNKKALLILCADNGIVEEGVTQTGNEVTAAVTAGMTRGESCACLMAEQAGVDVIPVDIGVSCELKNLGGRHPLLVRKICRGTRNFLREAAMTEQEALAAVLTGISLTGELKEQGYDIIATGEMGIGNTTTSSAVAACLLGVAPKLVTGKGAGLTKEGFERKNHVIELGIALRRPDAEDGLDVLKKVGGLDLAGLCGVFLGGAIHRIPVVIDGFISAAAAAAAKKLCRSAGDYMIASHVSAEPGGLLLLDYLEKKPVIQGGLRLGEGTGALTLFPLLDMALAVYRGMSTFADMEIQEYQPL